VEETLRSTGQAEIEANEVGLAILAPLRELDEVAYLRYASVYRNFTSLEDFEGEIALLRALPSNAIDEINDEINDEIDAVNSKKSTTPSSASKLTSSSSSFSGKS
jgi:transcriptional repressor NrdR